MDRTEHEQAQDDFEVEITDLPGAGSVHAPSDEPASQASSRSPLRPRFTPRQRRLQLAITIAMVALVLLLILVSYTPARNTALLALLGSTPTPTPTLSPGSNLFYVRADPPWGRLSLDGHLLSHLPVVGVDPPLQLAPGQHQLVWQAAPFRPLTCSISVPPAQADTCQANTKVYVNPDLDAQVIELHDSLATLPTAQRIALIDAAQADLDALQSTELLRPGELYVNAGQEQGRSASVAKQPLLATLRFQLDTGNQLGLPCSVNILCEFRGQDCRLFCALPVAARDRNSASTWNVAAVVHTAWEYTTLDGQPVAANQPDNLDGLGAIEHLVTLHITWNVIQWHVTFQPVNPFESFVSNLACASTEDAINFNPSLAGTWKLSSGPNNAAGCLAVATVEENDGGLSSPSQPVVAYCLHRFGIFLAANEIAHRLWPFMPMADSYEQSLAKRLATLSGWTFNMPPIGPFVSLRQGSERAFHASGGAVY